MNTLDDLVKYCKEKIKEYPQLRSQIIEEYQWAVSEVEAEESETHEVEKAITSIDEMILEFKEETS